MENELMKEMRDDGWIFMNIDTLRWIQLVSSV